MAQADGHVITRRSLVAAAGGGGSSVAVAGAVARIERSEIRDSVPPPATPAPDFADAQSGLRGSPDPTLAAIERHRAAFAALSAQMALLGEDDVELDPFFDAEIAAA